MIVLSCSDSRVPPEMVFDQGLGESSEDGPETMLDDSINAHVRQSVKLLQNRRDALQVNRREEDRLSLRAFSSIPERCKWCSNILLRPEGL